MDITNLSREAKKLRRWFEVFQHAEEVLQEEAVADERLRGLRAEQVEAGANLERLKEQGTLILTKAQDEQRRILEGANEEAKGILAKVEKERESLLTVMGKERAKLLAGIEGLNQQLSETENHVTQEKTRLSVELETAQSRHKAILEEMRDKERKAQEATVAAVEKLRLAQEALANLKANL